MNTGIRITFGAIVLLAVTASVALAANTSIITFESNLAQQLKKAFRVFYSAASQDRVYVQTDKTFYKPGETIWLSAYLRDEATLKPSTNSDIIHVELITPKGTTAQHYKLVAKSGVAQGDFKPDGLAGGIYKIRAYTEWQKNDAGALLFEKEITIQNNVMPRLKMKLDFGKKAYGKGDEVIVNLELNSNNNKPLAYTKAKFVAQLAGIQLTESNAVTDEEGKAILKFKLPAGLNTIDGTVNVLIDFEGSTESISRSVPIVLNKIALQFFPEGGDAVAGVKSKIAFRATNEFGKPADVEGIIVDAQGTFVAKFNSYHFGMGAFELQPAQNQTYKARITKPAGILDEFELPEVLKAGYVMNIAHSDKDALNIRIHSFRNEELTVVAQERGEIYYARSFNAVKGDNNITIDTRQIPIGVTQITLFDSKGIARNERLAFVNKDQQLNISVTTDKKQYQPREKVTMNIKVTDPNGLPMPGIFSLSVVDDNLLSFADDKQGNILAKMLLEPELQQKVEEANFYFNKKEEKADKALDYLLMTSGWRRYTWKQINSGELPVVSHEAEKAVLTGIVYDGYGGQPLPGATLKLKGVNRTTVTGPTGKFEIKGFDISQAGQVEISAPNYNTQTQPIYNYGNSNYYLYNNRHVYRYMAVPQAAGAVDLAVAEVAAAKAPKGGMVKMKKDAIAEQEEMAFDKTPPAPVVADWVDEPREEDGEGLDVDDNFAAGDVADLREAEFKNADKKIAGGPRVVFYRAKEFPKRVYTAADTTRNDLVPTVYWNGYVIADKSGKAKVEFLTNDLISSFKATVEGFGDDGSIGRTEYNYATGLPFSMDAKIPAELVSGDKVMLPLFLKNTTAEPVTGKLVIAAPAQLQIASTPAEVTIAANQTKVVYLNCTATNRIGAGELKIEFKGTSTKDALTRAINVVAKGFPATIALSGQDLSKEFLINPVNVVPGSMKVSFTAYPNIMSELMSGVDAILREPYGCFEQTSSSNYPNIMVLDYLRNSKTPDPKIEARAKKLLDDGYKKLVSFETKENGYEWFGAAPAHEALTAYGLMEFEDMKKVYPHVDQNMINRTAKLLLDKRDGNGGFKKNPRALDSFGGADEDITNCYIVWALTESGRANEVEKEIDAAWRAAKKSSDPYMLALMANALFNAGDTKRAEELVTELINERREAQSWTGKKHSITRSTGENLRIETTSLALLALMKSANPNVAAVTTGVKYLVGARNGSGGFGTTQATILALKALTRYAEFSKKTDEAGTVEVLINGMPIATKDYAKGERNDIAITGLEKFIGQGKQKVVVRFKGCKEALPYAMNVSYSTTLPVSSNQCAVSLNTRLSANSAKVGETVRLTAMLKNKTAEGQPMTMAIIGIPAGFSAQPWQLKELQEKGTIDFYEVAGNNIACYYRALAPYAQKQINLDLKAEIPGEFDAPASSAYLYYTNEHKDWVALDRVTIMQ